MYCRFRCFLLLIGLLVGGTINAQNSIWDVPKNAGKNVATRAGKTVSRVKQWKDHLQQWGLDSNYTHSLQAGVRLYTNGLGGLLLYQRTVATGKLNIVQLSFAEVKHEKQVKQQRENKTFPQLGAASPYIYGKINNLYQLQLGIGREQLLLPGVLDGNISVSFRVQAGFSLALLKPYYLRLIYVQYSPDTAYLEEQRYDESNSDRFLNAGTILGASKWSKGLSEIRFVPGGYIDGAFVLQPGRNKTFVQTVTFGGQLALYAQKLPIMADRRSYPWVGALYVGLCLGKRWK